MRTPRSKRSWLLASVILFGAARCGGGAGPGESHDDADLAQATIADLAEPDLTCQPTTDCESAGRECGSLKDGCGHKLNCGTCDAPESCGGGGTPGVCGCTPRQCVTGSDCGTIPDGCGGTAECGGCSGANSCGGAGVANQCGCTPSPTLCDSLQCGTVTSACGAPVACGACASTAVCGAQAANLCGAGKRIFATKATFPATFGGLWKADSLCAAAAKPAGLGSSWKAWLSDDSTDAFDRIDDVGPWYLTGTDAKVFLSKAQLGMFPSVPIDHDEYGQPIPMLANYSEFAWTGTALGGAKTPFFDSNCQEYCDWSCYSWTKSSSIRPNFYATVGRLKDIDEGWTHFGADDCSDGKNHLICIEQ